MLGSNIPFAFFKKKIDDYYTTTLKDGKIKDYLETGLIDENYKLISIIESAEISLFAYYNTLKLNPIISYACEIASLSTKLEQKFLRGRHLPLSHFHYIDNKFRQMKDDRYSYNKKLRNIFHLGALLAFLDSEKREKFSESFVFYAIENKLVDADEGKFVHCEIDGSHIREFLVNGEPQYFTFSYNGQYWVNEWKMYNVERVEELFNYYLNTIQAYYGRAAGLNSISSINNIIAANSKIDIINEAYQHKLPSP